MHGTGEELLHECTTDTELPSGVQVYLELSLAELFDVSLERGLYDRDAHLLLDGVFRC